MALSLIAMNAEVHWGTLFISATVVFFIGAIWFWASRYVRCPSDRILVIFGKVGEQRAASCIHGGGRMVWPLIQDYAFLSLTPMTINIPLTGALSFQNIRINVPSTFTVGVSTQPAIMNNAAERLLGLAQNSIEEMGREIIFGQLRLTVASLTIEQINQDRESFLESIRKNVEPELNKIGLYLINVNITDITDEAEYIESIGKKAAAEAVNKAKIDVAEQLKVGAIGEADANREKDIKVAENLAEADKGRKKAEANKRIFIQGQEAEAIEGENKSKALIAKSQSQLEIEQAQAKQLGDIAKYNAEAEIQKSQAKAELERLKAEEVVREEIQKTKIVIAAEAEAEKARTVAQGKADSVLKQYLAQAEGTAKLLEAKANGYDALVKSCNGDTKSAATLLMVEKLDEIVKMQTEAIKNIKIDKVTVWDGNNGDGKSSTANFLSGMVKSLPPLHDIAGIAGVELPEFLGKVSQEQPAEGTAPEKKA